MTFNLNSTVLGFLLAVLVYFLFNAIIGELVTDATAQKTFRIILLIICVVIALGGSLLVRI